MIPAVRDSPAVFEKGDFCNFYNLMGINSAAATPKSLQSYPTLCNPIDGNPTGSHIPGILPARTLECVVISFSNA